MLRVLAPTRAWALAALQGGRLSLEEAAAMLRLQPGAFAEQLARLGLESPHVTPLDFPPRRGVCCAHHHRA